MNSERDYLNAYIFPKIKEYCKKRYIDFIPVDLRWGITEEESRNGLVLTTCLEEIDDSRPFFIGLLGSRYGWQPTVNDLKSLRPSLSDQKGWIENMMKESASITEIEFEYAALRDMKLPYACFFMRSEGVDIPEDFKEETGSMPEQKLNKLKEKILSQHKYPAYHYTSNKALGDILYREITTMVDKEFPIDGHNGLDAILWKQEQTLKKRLDTSFYMNDICEHIDQWIQSEEKLLLIKGDKEGIGSSTSLCYGVKYLRNKYNNPIVYFDFGTIPPEQDKFETFYHFLSLDACRIPTGQWGIIAIDNAHFDSNELTSILTWLDSLHNGIHVIFSTHFYSTLYDTIAFRYSCPVISLHERNDTEKFIDNYTARYGKRFTQEQKEIIIAQKSTRNPTYLKIILNNLINFGSYEKLNERIKKLVSQGEDFIFLYLMQEANTLFHTINLHTTYPKYICAISLFQGIYEDELLNMLNISRSEWSVIHPWVMQFCKEEEGRYTLINPDWGHQIKNLYPTPEIAQLGMEMIDWFLKDDSLLKRSIHAALSIYLNIWHLPFTEEAYQKLHGKMLFIGTSPIAVNYLSINKLSTLWRLLRKHRMTDKPTFWLGCTISELNTKEKIEYFTKLGKVASGLCRGTDASYCYTQIYQIKSTKGENDAILYHAKSLMEIGQMEKAIEIINHCSQYSGWTPINPGNIFKKIHKNDKRLSLKLINLKINAYKEILNYKACDKLFQDYIKLLESLDDDQYNAIKEDATKGLMTLIEIGSFDGNLDNLNTAIDYSNMIADFIKSLGIGHPLSYLYNLYGTIRQLRQKRYSDMLKWTTWTLKSASIAYGQSSYQYARAEILYVYAHYKTQGTHGISHQATNVYIPRNYTRSFETENLPTIEWSRISHSVKRKLILERDFYKRLIREIQPYPKQQEMDNELDKFKERISMDI